MKITSRTRLLGLIGNPARDSLSPVMHNRAFQVCDLDLCYLSFEVELQELEPAIRGMAALGFAGFNVTIPYKEAVIPYLDTIQKEALLIGAVNTVVINEGKMHGFNTDGTGFARSLEEKGIAAAGKNVLIIGSGGAAKAVGMALALRGAESITVANRNLERAEELAQTINGIGVKSDTICTEILNWETKLNEIHIVINTTPLGMYPMENRCPINVAALMPEAVVCDLVYKPRTTVLLREAALCGHTTVGGLGMLLHQGAEAFRLFTSVEPPVEAMRKALDVAI